ncbi:MAG: hypothetical protein AAGN35_09760 [Bacteroidota bacterium]
MLNLRNAFWAMIFVGFAALLPAQTVYPDTSLWIGQWAEEGELTYTLDAMLVEDEQGWVSGYFEWTMIYSPYFEHWDKVGYSGREYLEGKRHKLTGFYHLKHTRIEQTKDVISGDEYILQVVNGGMKMFGRNYRPTNYQGSLYALKVPELTPSAFAAVPPEPRDLSETKKSDLATPPEPPKVDKLVTPDPENPDAPEVEVGLAAVEEGPEPTPVPPKDFSDRTVLMKDEVTVGQDKLRIEIWDKSMVDGDIVSLSLNGKVVLSDFRVSRQKRTVFLDLQEGENLLVMHAENLGRVPPNTAAVAVYRNGQGEVYILNSDLGKSEAIRILRQ